MKFNHIQKGDRCMENTEIREFNRKPFVITVQTQDRL